MKKKLVIITTDNKIELAMFVEEAKLANTRKAIEEARYNYYFGGEHRKKSFKDVFSETMEDFGIDVEIVEHVEMQ